MEIVAEKPAQSKTGARYITLVAYRPKTQLPATARPCQDQRGLVFTGQGEHGYYELLTEQEKRALPYLITPDTSIILEDGKVFDLNNPRDAANWVWLQKHPYISQDKEAGENNRDVCFFIANPEKEAQQRVDSTEKIDDARYSVRKLSEKDRAHAAAVLGLTNPEAFTAQQVLDFLLGKASNLGTVTSVLEAIDPARRAEANARIFFNKALKWSVIERLKDGAYYFGGDTGFSVGINEQQVLEYLLNKENVERVKVMKATLVEKTKVEE